MIRLSLKYIRFFKQQTLYILLGIIVTVAMLTAVNSAFLLNNRIELERTREISGDYHYVYNRLDWKDIEKARGLAEEYSIEKVGCLQVGKVYGGYDNLTTIGLRAVDDSYKEMFGMTLLEGRMPEKSGEIALEEWVFFYFSRADAGASDGLKNAIGTRIALESDTGTDVYTVTGILKDREEGKGYGQKSGYVSAADVEDGYYQLYVKFNEEKDIKKLETAFSGAFEHEAATLNREVLYKIDYKTFNVVGYDVNLSHSADMGGGAVEGKMFREWLSGIGADRTLGIFFVTIFSMIILYSIFHISVQQRIREYGKLEAFGLETWRIGCLLGSELFFIALIGFPLGTLSGSLLIWGIYKYYEAGGTITVALPFSEILPVKYVLWNVVLLGFILLVIVLLVTVRLGRMSIIETLKGKNGGEGIKKCGGKENRIWSKKTRRMVPVLLMKYFQGHRGRVITMLFMLALSGTVFLTGSYVEGQIRRNNRLTQIVNNGTNADIRVAIENLRFSGGISEAQTEQIQALPQVIQADPVAFYPGAILLKKDQIRSQALENGYWESEDKRNDLVASLGGHLMSEGDENYSLKAEFYGYDEEMLKVLDDFVLDGSIDSVKNEDTVILQTLMNGVGDWDIIRFRAGDKITLRFPKENPGRITEENYRILGMLPEGEYEDAYEERTFTIGAVVKGGAANNEEFLIGGDASIAGIIMPNKRFRECFDVEGYNILSVRLGDRKLAGTAAGKIKTIMESTDGVSVVDYTEEIVRKEEYLTQTMMLVRIIVLLLLLIGFFNILSSVNYILVEKQREFAILRALGMTDIRLMGAMAGEGVVYGIFMDIFMIGFTLIIRFPVKYFMDHGFVFLNARYALNWPLILGVSRIHLLLCVAAVCIPAKRVLFHEIIDELSDTE